MKRIFQNLISAIIYLVIFASLLASTVKAQNPNLDPCADPNFPCGIQISYDTCKPKPNTSPGVENEEAFNATLDPIAECIDEMVQNVKITFHGLQPNKSDYVLCTGDIGCVSDKYVQSANDSENEKPSSNVIRNDGKTHNQSWNDQAVDKVKNFTADAAGNLEITVCGDGERKLMVSAQGADACPKNDKNYFFANRTYSISVGTKEGTANYHLDHPRAKASFIVYPFLPEAVYPEGGPNGTKLVSGKPLTVTLKQRQLRKGGEHRNNYQITLRRAEGDDYQEECLTIEQANVNKSVTFKNALTAGTYTITVNEQVSESGGRGPGGIVPGFVPGGDSCKGDDGFHYLETVCIVTNSTPKAGSCREWKKDPKGETQAALLKQLQNQYKEGGVPFPCKMGVKPDGKPYQKGFCPTFDSAIGPIPVTIEAFITELFQFALSIAGFGGVIVILVSGYMMMTAAGNKEKVQGARETITAAIVGLLFIILSIVILEIIGIDILKLPGFARP